MKRQADKQLTKDNEEVEEEEIGQGFQKADKTTLATRVIRALPNRNRPQNAAETPKPTSLFSMPPATTGSTSPFGLPQSTSTTTASPFANFSLKPPAADFTFKPTTTDSKETSLPSSNPFSAPSPSSFSFSTPQKTPFTFAPSTQGSSPPTVTATASNTSKAFASILSTTTPPSSFSFPSSKTSATSTHNDDKTSSDPTSLKYYTNIRGLNVSFLAAVSKAVDEDPFVDIAGVFESYKSTHARIQKEFDESSSTKVGSKSESTSSSQQSSNSGPTMPTPPASFTFGGSKPATPATASSTPATAPLASKPSFEFKPSAGLGSASTSNPFALPSKDTNSGSSSSIFGSSSIPKPVDKSSESSVKPSAGSSLFSFEKPATTPSPFGTFGSSAPVPFSFGSSTFASGDKPTATSAFSFGGSDKTSPSTTPKSFSFDSSGGSASSSVFGGMKPISGEGSTESTGENTVEVENSDRGTPATEGGEAEQVPTLIATNPWTEEGEGEENEETLHAVKVKAYKLAKAEDGSSKWATLGAGIIRLKKDKDSGARRMLLRNATNGKVVINFNIYAGLKPTQTKTALSFVGHDAGVSQTYTVRLANEGDANEFKSALDREISFVKARDES